MEPLVELGREVVSGRGIAAGMRGKTWRGGRETAGSSVGLRVAWGSVKNASDLR